MDILRNLFGNLTSGHYPARWSRSGSSPRPISSSSSRSCTRPTTRSTAPTRASKSHSGHGVDIDDISKTIDDVNRQVQREIQRSFHTAKKQRQPEEAGPLHPARQRRRPPDPALHRQVLSPPRPKGEKSRSGSPFERMRRVKPSADDQSPQPPLPLAARRRGSGPPPGVDRTHEIPVVRPPVGENAGAKPGIRPARGFRARAGAAAGGSRSTARSPRSAFGDGDLERPAAHRRPRSPFPIYGACSSAARSVKLFDLGPIEDLLRAQRAPSRSTPAAPRDRSLPNPCPSPVPGSRRCSSERFCGPACRGRRPTSSRPVSSSTSTGPSSASRSNSTPTRLTAPTPPFERDHLRDEDLVLAGIELIRVTDVRFHREPTAVLNRVATLLARRAELQRRAGRSRPSRRGAVEARPGLAGGELALEAVEAAEAAAEVVDHVDEDGLAGGGDDRRAVLERAVVAEDDVEDAPGPGRGRSRGSPRSRGAPGSSRAGSRPAGGRRR